MWDSDKQLLAVKEVGAKSKTADLFCRLFKEAFHGDYILSDEDWPVFEWMNKHIKDDVRLTKLLRAFFSFHSRATDEWGHSPTTFKRNINIIVKLHSRRDVLEEENKKLRIATVAERFPHLKDIIEPDDLTYPGMLSFLTLFKSLSTQKPMHLDKARVRASIQALCDRAFRDDFPASLPPSGSLYTTYNAAFAEALEKLVNDELLLSIRSPENLEDCPF